MARQVGEYLDITPPSLDDEQDTIPSIDMMIKLAESRRRHVGQGVLELEDLMV